MSDPVFFVTLHVGYPIGPGGRLAGEVDYPGYRRFSIPVPQVLYVWADAPCLGQDYRLTFPPIVGGAVVTHYAVADGEDRCLLYGPCATVVGDVIIVNLIFPVRLG